MNEVHGTAKIEFEKEDGTWEAVLPLCGSAWNVTIGDGNVTFADFLDDEQPATCTIEESLPDLPEVLAHIMPDVRAGIKVICKRLEEFNYSSSEELTGLKAALCVLVGTRTAAEFIDTRNSPFAPPPFGTVISALALLARK